MRFGDDWENEMAGLKALRKDVNYLIGNGSGKIPEYLKVGRTEPVAVNAKPLDLESDDLPPCSPAS